MRCLGCAGAMAEAPPESNAPGAFPFVLLVRFAETCVLADPAAVDELYLHVFCSCSVVYFVRVLSRHWCACPLQFYAFHATQINFVRVYVHVSVLV